MTDDGWRQHRVLALENSFESRKTGSNHPHAGKRYRYRTLADVLSCYPTSEKKGLGPCVLAHGNLAPDGRSLEGARAGRFVMLWSDLDSGNPDIDDVADAVTKFAGLGAAGRLYSTSSSKPDDRRLRVLIPLGEPVSVAEWVELQQALSWNLEKSGFQIDRSCERPTQPIFLPNLPPGGPGVFEDRRFGERGMRPTSVACTSALARVRVTQAEQRRAIEASAAEARQRREQRLADQQSAGIVGAAVVARWNAAVPLEAALAQYGYLNRPGTNDWRSPLQTGKTYGTRIYGDRAVSVSWSDAAAGLGRPTDGWHISFDAFDLFVHFEHGGNYAKAVRAAAEQLGIAHGPGAADVGQRRQA